MSDPMNRNDPPLRQTPPPAPPPADPDTTRKGNPMLWLLVLVALLVLGWYLLSQRDAEPLPPTETSAPLGEVDDLRATDAPATRPGDRRPAEPRAPARPVQPVLADRDATVSNRIEPEYPIAAARARDEGTVLVTAQVGADGKPIDVSVTRSSRSRELDRAAIEAVRQWTFEPAVRNGEAVASTVQVPVEFTLDQR